MASHLLAIDQGTTGSTVLLVGKEGRVLAKATEEFPQHFPRPGWVEHEAEEIWQSVLHAIERAYRESGLKPSECEGIGITNQRETTLIWERRSGKPIHRALVWQDRRSAPQCQALREKGHEDFVRTRTGLVIDPYFSATKIAWLLDHVDGARARAARGELAFGTVDTFLVWRLSGGAVHVTDPSNASRTLLYDLEKGAFSQELASLFDVPFEILPSIASSSEIYAKTKGVPGLPDGIPIAAIAGDQQSALFGQGCFDEGEAKCTYGTGAFLLVQSGERIVRSSHGLLSTVAWKLGQRTFYALEGSSFVAGALIQWLRDGLGIIQNANEIDSLAGSVESSEGVVFVPALTGLGAPHWDPDARGLIHGITRGTTKAHIARAALEGIAFSVADLVQAMEADMGRPIAHLRVDGGVSQSRILLAFQADLLNAVIEKPESIESTALGAAFLAGLAVGFFSGLSELRGIISIAERYNPRIGAQERQSLRLRWMDAIERTRSSLRRTQRLGEQ
ncbi:MAG: glycerol kinase GlpK [Sandaracinaceae bacterium]|nr:glycerol kinase GlpK [Sandaracinaceae bacterium]